MSKKTSTQRSITMASVQKIWQGFVAIVMVTAAMLILVTMASAQDNGKRQAGQGKYAQLTAQWWQWILEQPVTGNPNFDETGEDAANGQPREDIFFLAGTFGGTATREITVPAGTALFFPLLNNVGIAPQPAPQPKRDQNQVPQLRTLFAAPLIDSVTELHVTLDDGDGPVSLLDAVTRVKSPVFKFTQPDEDSILGPGTFKAESDGYWLFLPPLPAGTYVLNFGGTSDGLTVDIRDIITVE
jgi:hypothetical protein